MTTSTAVISGLPVDVWEEGMHKAEQRMVDQFPGAEFRGLVQTNDGKIATCGRIPAHETRLVLTGAEWGAIRWLITKQATMMWTISNQLKHSNPELRPLAEWWKALEEKVSAAIDDFAPDGSIDSIVKQGMETSYDALRR